MSKIKKSYFRGLITLMTLIVIIGFTSLNSSAKESSNILTEESIKSMMGKVKPLVEEITGRKYKSEIEIQIIKPKALKKIIFLEDLQRLKKSYLGSSGDELAQKQAESLALGKSELFVAKYAITKHALYITPENVNALKTLYNISNEDLYNFILIIVADEMVLALDDQCYDLVKLRDEQKSREQMNAFYTVVSGSIGYVTGLIADRLKISETLHSNSLRVTLHSGQGKNPEIEKDIYYFRYIKGSEFIRTLINKKGIAGYELAFTKLPTSTRQIYFPEEYFNAPTKADINWMHLLDNIADKFPVKIKPSLIFDSGILDLLLELMSKGINRDEAIRLADKLYYMAGYYAGKNPLSSIKLEICDFKDYDAAMEYHELIEKITKKSNTELMINPKIKIVINDENQDLKMDGFDMAKFTHSELKAGLLPMTGMEICGIADGLYIRVTSTNRKDITKDDFLSILNLVYTEQLRMKEERNRDNN